MKFKKQLLGLTALAIIGTGATSVLANSRAYVPANTDVYYEVVQEDVAINLFSTVNGTVTQVFEMYVNEEGKAVYAIEIQNEEEATYHVVISENTAIIKEGQLVSLENINEGDELMIHFQSFGATPAIYPTRVNASAVVVTASETALISETDFTSVHVDVFVSSSEYESELVSTDGSLRFTPSEEIRVVDLNNETYEGTLENKQLAVIYTASTMSIPAIPLDPKIVVLGNAEDVSGFDMIEMPEMIEIPQIPMMPKARIIVT